MDISSETAKVCADKALKINKIQANSVSFFMSNFLKRLAFCVRLLRKTIQKQTILT